MTDAMAMPSRERRSANNVDPEDLADPGRPGRRARPPGVTSKAARAGSTASRSRRCPSAAPASADPGGRQLPGRSGPDRSRLIPKLNAAGEGEQAPSRRSAEAGALDRRPDGAPMPPGRPPTDDRRRAISPATRRPSDFPATTAMTAPSAPSVDVIGADHRHLAARAALSGRTGSPTTFAHAGPRKQQDLPRAHAHRAAAIATAGIVTDYAPTSITQASVDTRSDEPRAPRRAEDATRPSSMAAPRPPKNRDHGAKCGA